MPFAELDGMRLYYERAGSGEPELLFVPGWCCDHNAFRPQFEHFARTHSVTALDLRGCGQSDRPEDGYRIPDLADDLARFCAEVGITNPVVVGHSMGGMVGIDLAARHPTVPRALVLVDPGPIHPTPEVVEAFEEFEEQLTGPTGEEVRRKYVEEIGPLDDKLARSVADVMCAVPLPVAIAVIRGVIDWNGPTAFARCAVPTLLLRYELDVNRDGIRLPALKPDLELGITVGAGHFHQLDVPDQVNAMIERFLTTAL